MCVSINVPVKINAFYNAFMYIVKELLKEGINL